MGTDYKYCALNAGQQTEYGWVSTEHIVQYKIFLSPSNQTTDEGKQIRETESSGRKHR
jgi:hypothetical protein